MMRSAECGQSQWRGIRSAGVPPGRCQTGRALTCRAAMKTEVRWRTICGQSPRSLRERLSLRHYLRYTAMKFCISSATAAQTGSTSRQSLPMSWSFWQENGMYTGMSSMSKSGRTRSTILIINYHWVMCWYFCRQKRHINPVILWKNCAMPLSMTSPFCGFKLTMHRTGICRFIRERSRRCITEVKNSTARNGWSI